MPLDKAPDKRPFQQKGSGALAKPGRQEKKVKLLASPWLQKLIPGIGPGAAPGQSPRVTWEQSGIALVYPRSHLETAARTVPRAAWSSTGPVLGSYIVCSWAGQDSCTGLYLAEYQPPLQEVEH